jgi:hypothetical protein
VETCIVTTNNKPDFSYGYICAYCGKRSNDPTHLCVPKAAP